MPTIIRSEIKHNTCNWVAVEESIAESVRVNPNGMTRCPVCNLDDKNLHFNSVIELDDGYILER